MTACIPPAVAALAAALDAHEWRLCHRAHRIGREEIPHWDPIARRCKASRDAVRVARESLMWWSASDDPLGHLSRVAHNRTACLPIGDRQQVSQRRVAAYLRWCVRRLRALRSGT